MKKIIIIPDSFKGTMSAVEVTDIIASSIKKRLNANIVKMPIADGGEGSVDVIIAALGGEKKKVQALSPEGNYIGTTFGITGDTAVVEIAEAAGITKQKKLNAMTSNTYGFGEQIKAALDLGIRKFTLCLGGSATTDGGSGMAAALGAKFLKNDGTEFVPCGNTLYEIDKIDIDSMDKRLAGSEVTVMCDVKSPLFGKTGAAYVFSPQKGATAAQVEFLDRGLQNYAIKLQETFKRDFSDIEGSGAAGGAGAGCLAFLNAKLESGIDALLNLYNFDKEVENADLVITGEGKLDLQSFMGKALSGIIARSKGKKIVSFCGKLDMETESLAAVNVTAFETSPNLTEFERKFKSKPCLKAAVRNMLYSFDF